jgi:hypothetical protein
MHGLLKSDGVTRALIRNPPDPPTEAAAYSEGSKLKF